MSATAIFNVTSALRDRLQAAVARYNPPATVFVGPLDDVDSSSATLVLFLYRIIPNPSLRNREHTVTSNSATPPVIVYRNSLPLDLYFLVTVGTTSGPGEEDLLKALGFGMQEIQSDPELIIKDQTVRVTPEPLSTEESSRIWALFPTANYRTSIAYLASPVWIDPLEEAPLAARVAQDQFSAGPRIGPIPEVEQ